MSAPSTGQFNPDETPEERAAREAAAKEAGTGVEAPTFVAPSSQTKQQTAPAPTAAPEQKGSGSFQNLGKFIEANKGKSEQFAGGVAGGLESKLSGAAGKLGQAIEARRGEIRGKASGGLDVGAPEQFTGQGEQFSRIQSFLGQRYGGPSAEQAAATQDIVGGEQELGKQAAIVGGTATSEGLGNVTGEYYKDLGLQARRGESAFDQLLLGRDVGAQKTFEGLRGRVPGIQEQAAAQKGTLAGEAQAAAESYGREQDKVRKQLEDIRGAWASGVESRRAGLEAANVAKKAQLEAEGKGKYLTGQTGVTWQQALTPEAVARLNALASLTGTGQTFKEGEYGGAGVIGYNEGAMTADRLAAEKAAADQAATKGITTSDFTKGIGIGGDAARIIGAGSDILTEATRVANPMEAVNVTKESFDPMTATENAANRFQNIRKKWRF